MLRLQVVLLHPIIRLLEATHLHNNPAISSRDINHNKDMVKGDNTRAATNKVVIHREVINRGLLKVVTTNNNHNNLTMCNNKSQVTTTATA